MSMVPQDVQEAIEDLVARWIEQGIVKDARNIGDGSCEEFAEEVLAGLKVRFGTAAEAVALAYGEDWWARALLEDGSPDPDNAEMFFADIPRLRAEGAPLPSDVPDDDLANLIGSATHVWITFEGNHFDASAPDGRTHFLLMPFYADQIAGLQAEMRTA